jgi:hypothetical protein
VLEVLEVLVEVIGVRRELRVGVLVVGLMVRLMVRVQR